MKRYFLNDPAAGFYSVTAYGTDKRDARNRYRSQWYPDRDRLPRGITLWEA